jgi:hypothetical protein
VSYPRRIHKKERSFNFVIFGMGIVWCEVRKKRAETAGLRDGSPAKRESQETPEN